MIETQFSMFDSVVLVIVGLSSLIAFFRGFVKEILSLGAWIGAAVITIYSFPYVTDYLKPHFSSAMVATGIATLGTYICALFAISLVNSIIIRYLKTGAEVGMVDNILGLVFGAARGALVVCLAFLLVKPFIAVNSNYPNWVQEAKTFPAVQYGANLLIKAAPEYLADLDKVTADAKRKVDGSIDGASESLDRMENGMERELDQIEEGYDDRHLRNMDRVIDSTTRNP